MAVRTGGEALFSFSSYSTKLHQAYSTIGRLRVDPGDQAKVHRLVEGMNVPQCVELTIAKSHVMDNLMDNWTMAVNYLATKVGQAFPTAAKKRKPMGPGRRISEAKKGRPTGGGGRGHGKGRGKGGGGGNATFNGVDCSDFRQNFSNGQMNQMGPEGRAYIRRKRFEAKRQEQGGGGRGNYNRGGDGGGRGRGYYGRGGCGGRGNDQRSIAQAETGNGSGQAAENERAIVPYSGAGRDDQDGQQHHDSSGDYRSAQGRGGRAGAGFGRGAYGRGGRGGRY